MEPNKVPFEYCHRWLVSGLKIGERNYTLFLVCGLLMYIVTFIASIIPFVGHIASLLLLFLFALGAMRLTQQILKFPDAKNDLDTYLKFVFDPVYFQRFQMQIGILVGLGAVTLAMSYVRLTSLIFLSSSIIYMITALFIFSAFMALENPALEWHKALEKVFQGIILNLGVYICAGLLFGLFAVVSLALCFVPFLLYFVPMTFSVCYLIYASIFENLDIEALITEWSSKTHVETVTLPPEV